MTAARPRTLPAAQRRRELMDAGLAVFTEHGVAAATVDQVTRAAGVAKGTFYLHFQSKEQLLAALQADFEHTMVVRIDRAVAALPETDWSTRLDAWLDAALDDYPAERAVHDVLFHHTPPPQPSALPDDERRDLPASLADVLRGGAAAGVFDVPDVELTALLLCGALHRTFDHVWHRKGTADPARLQAATRAVFRRAVRAVPD